MSERQTIDRRSTHAALWLLLAALAFAPLSGCGGCSKNDSDDQQAEKDKADKKKEDEAKKKKEKPKPDFEIEHAIVEPFDPDRPVLSAKPGHLLPINQQMKTNNFDFVGEMTGEIAMTGPEKQPLAVPVLLNSSRPIALPKGQVRFPELPLLVPRAGPESQCTLFAELRGRGGGSVKSEGTPLTTMPPYQFYFFVLAREHLRYRSLDRLDAIRGPSSSGLAAYYRYMTPPLEKQVSLPAHPLAWTSIAYVLWDEVDPSALSPEQQQAMLDWLHWGGQLIVSGPGALNTLRGSFLAPYLPAAEGPVRDLSAETLAPLSDYWTPTKGKAHRPLQPVRPWSGIELVKAPEAEFMPHTGELVVERHVGRGRIVATAFKLSLSALQKWPGFDSFVNGCLMRHPAREFVQPRDTLTLDASLKPQWYQHSDRIWDARLTSGVRYVGRDLAADGSFAEDRVHKTEVDETQVPLYGRTARVPGVFGPGGPQPDPNATMDEEGTDIYGSGVAGWSDSSAVSTAARDSLAAAAGIDIPKAGFVAWMLAAYLVVLVPVNWGLFKVVRRVEWAWVAVPVIALAGAVVVTKAANLNIGFARSQTEIGVLELQPSYRRGHLTRYTALYTSLSTNYDVKFNDPHALVQPLALESQGRPGATREQSTYTLRHDPAEVSLGGFGVSSNATSMLHSEQMYDVGGTISLADSDGAPVLRNRTRFTFAQAGVLRVTAEGQVQAAWLGRLEPGEAGRPLNFRSVESEGSESSPRIQAMFPQWHDEPVLDPSIPPLSLTRLAGMTVGRKGLVPGDVRLIASLNEPLPGMEVDPVASQATRAAVLVVANLKYAPPLEPQADYNSRQDPPADLRDESLESEPAK
jgi:hypothetical protein